jgi:hypothetical protein
MQFPTSPCVARTTTLRYRLGGLIPTYSLFIPLKNQ